MSLGPAHKRYLFEAIVVAMLTGFFVFVIYANLHYPGGAWPNPWPLWLRYTIPGWFMANVLLTALLRERMLRRDTAEGEKTRLARATSWHIALGFGIVWLLIFLYVVAAGVRGRFPFDRAIAPAIFCLLFTWAFSWALYLAERGKG